MNPFRRTHSRGRAGFTLLEMAVSVAVLAVLLETLLNGAISMTRSTQFGEKRSRMMAKVQRALDHLHAELLQTSTDVDPVTGAPYVTVGGSAPMETLTFRRVVNYGNNGAELEPIWSTPITYAVAGAQLTRTQDGVSTLLMAGATQLEFDLQSNGRITVTLAATGAQDGVAPDTVVQQVSIPTSF